MKNEIRSQFRIPADLAEWLKAKAKEENRSMNGQLVAELKAAMLREVKA